MRIRMINKKLDDITKQDIDDLVDNEVRESRTVEYKRQLPAGSDADKKEFLADVSSFANTSGGDLLYGVSEEEGIPTSAHGLSNINIDDEILRLGSILTSGLEPRIPGTHFRPIEGFSDGPVLMLRIPKSWTSPHMVKFKGSSRFHARTSAGKYQMDVQQIGSAFSMSESLPERIRQFRDDRLAKIRAGETPMRLIEGAKLVLHLVPLESFGGDSQLDIAQIGDQFQPLKGHAIDRRINIDGVVSYSLVQGDDALFVDYCQVFRSGRLEIVEGALIRSHNNQQIMGSSTYEPAVIEAVPKYLRALQDLGVSCPIIVMLSMLGTLGAYIWIDNTVSRNMTTTIDRDVLLLPDVVIEDYNCDIPKTLRPAFDAVWNASGYPRSINYDENGDWSPYHERGGRR